MNSALVTTALLTQAAILSAMSEKGGKVFSDMIAKLNGNPSDVAAPHEGEVGPDGVFKPPVRSSRKDPRVPDSPGRRKQKPRPKDKLLE